MGMAYRKAVPLSALPEVPRTKAAARAAIHRVARALGGGYHPDTPGGEYQYSTDENPHVALDTFSDAARRRYDAVHDAAFTLIGDEVYEVALPIISRAVSRQVAKARRFK